MHCIIDLFFLGIGTAKSMKGSKLYVSLLHELQITVLLNIPVNKPSIKELFRFL
jgi:hypothetical protein